MDSTPPRQRVKGGEVDLEGGEAEPDLYSPKAKRKTTMWRSEGDDAELSEFQRVLEAVVMQLYPYRWHILCGVIFLVRALVHTMELTESNVTLL
jgi:hypothetical protein